MKHLFNNLSSEEKNNILKQHNGGKKIFNENFNKLIKHKSGSVKPISEQSSPSSSPVDIVNKSKESVKNVQNCLSEKGATVPQTCLSAINTAMEEAAKLPKGETPDFSKMTVFFPCMMELGMKTPDAIGALFTCMTEEINKMRGQSDNPVMY